MATNAELAAIKAARNSGALRVTLDGQSVNYRSLDDMDRIISDIERELSVDVVRKRPRVSSLGATLRSQ